MQPAVRHLNKMQCRENMSGALVYTILFENIVETMQMLNRTRAYWSTFSLKQYF